MLKRSLAIIVFLSLALFMAVKFYHAKLQASQGETLPFAVNCSNLKVGMLRFSGRVLVHDHWIRKFDLSHHPELAVEQQLKFLAGDIHFGSLSQLKTKLILLNEHRVLIKKINTQSYGKNLLITPDANQVGLEIKSPDAALSIEYEAEQSIAICGNELEKLSIDLPVDPYTAFWLVPKPEWRPFIFLKQREVVNPCANSEIVSAPHASGYPFLWLPRAEGIDANGAAFQCDQWLHQGIEYQTANGSFSPELANSKKLRLTEVEKLPELNMALFFGLVSGGDEEKSLDAAKTFFLNHKGDLFTIIESERHATSQIKEKQDASVFAALYFLHQLCTLATLDHFEVESSQKVLTIHAQATLKTTKKKLHINIHIASTNYSYDWQKRPLLQEMQDSQFIFYIGHSAIGENLDWSRVSAGFPKKQNYQMIGVISCYSTAFYPSYYEKYRAIEKLKTDLLLVDLVSYRYLLPLGILSYLDHVEVPGHATLAQELSKFVSGTEIVLWQRKGE